MTTDIDSEITRRDAKNVVLTFLSALNSEDFELAKECLSNNMTFDGSIRNVVEKY